MPIIKFNDPGEFCDELNKEVAAGRIPDRGVVRLTTRYTMSRLSPNIRHVCVLATYSTFGEVTMLEHYCGDAWGLGQDDAVMKKVKETHAHVERACKVLNLDVRAGVVEETPERK